MEVENFEPLKDKSDHEGTAIGALLMQCIVKGNDCKEISFKIEGAFIPVCPYQDAFNERICTYTEQCTKPIILHNLIYKLY